MPFKFNPTTGQLDLVGTGSGGGGATSLNGLSDVDLTSDPPEEGEALVYDGSGFVPASPPVYIEVQNNSGADISKGTPVYVSGTAGSGNPEISEADSDGVDTFPAIGLVANTITDGSSGRVLVSGVLEGLDTSLFGANDALYLSSTAGQLTSTRPTSDTEKVQKVGLVTRSDASSGRILVIGAGRTNDVPNELTALTGVALNDTDLGSFTGELIPDGQNIKEALQSLETAAETVAGADTQVLFNDGGALGGDAGLVYDKTTDKLTVGGDIDLDDGGTFSTTLQTVTPTANRTVSIPDATGTIGLVNGPTGSIQFNEAGTLNGTSDFSTTLNWNNAATTFTGLKLNITDTASAVDSKLLDLQINGTSRITASTPSGIPTLDLLGGGTVYIDKTSTNGILIGNYAGRSIRLGSATSIIFCSGSPASGFDVQIKREQANVLVVTDGSTGTGYLKLIPTTVGALTAAATVGAGAKAFVTDSTNTLASDHGQVVVGGGTNFVPVFSDGIDWRVG